jgi:hypothetical protein
MQFLKIPELSLETINWQESVFITIDVDWASDDVLNDTLELLKKAQTKATILMTHKTDLIDDIKNNDLFELGIHPNFNFLLTGDFRYGKNYKEVIDFYMQIAPDAKVVRSHSVTQNTPILDYFMHVGLRYDLNTEIPFSSNIKLQPYEDWTGLIKLPYFWQENISFSYSWELEPNHFLKSNGLKVFNFHPIHIFLNSENNLRYHNAKHLLQNYHELKKNVNYEKTGVRNFLEQLIIGR